LNNKLEDVHKQLLKCMQQIKSLSEDGELKQKELEELKGATQIAVDMVDPLEEGVFSTRTLLKRLREASQRISDYVCRTTRTFVAHVLGLIKSFYPNINVGPLTDGMAADYSD
jgi:hypothetical protein